MFNPTEQKEYARVYDVLFDADTTQSLIHDIVHELENCKINKYTLDINTDEYPIISVKFDVFSSDLLQSSYSEGDFEIMVNASTMMRFSNEILDNHLDKDVKTLLNNRSVYDCGKFMLENDGFFEPFHRFLISKITNILKPRFEESEKKILTEILIILDSKEFHSRQNKVFFEEAKSQMDQFFRTFEECSNSILDKAINEAKIHSIMSS